MLLPPGTRLGAYEIHSALGAGGMGEVYRARDTRLGRDVALKVLPDLFTRDPERLARFQREAQVLAALNHPHIGAIYGLEEANGQQILVLELVDGETLADRIGKGPIPVDEALPIVRQIAEALEAAHERGIIHRDLKPANIALTHEGNVKVLDFGLAKAASASASAEALNSPTITSPAMLTGMGVILGTAAYMSPEQARGKAVDKRSDVWAFGCVLFEMLTGKRAFQGDDVTDTIAAVVRGEPDWLALPANLPPHVRAIVTGCLQKDRRLRFSDISVPAFLMSGAARFHARRRTATVRPPRTAGTRCRRGGRRRHRRRRLGAETRAATDDPYAISHYARRRAAILESRPHRACDLAGRDANRVRRKPSIVFTGDVGDRGAPNRRDRGLHGRRHQSRLFAGRTLDRVSRW
jgi:serine/threonine protein kinase